MYRLFGASGAVFRRYANISVPLASAATVACEL
jgi:hypothetical protein